MQIGSALVPFVLFYRDTVGVGIRIMPDSGHLPGDLAARFAAGNLEAIVGDLLVNVQNMLSRGADGCELIAEVLVQGLKIIGQADPGLAFGIQ